MAKLEDVELMDSLKGRIVAAIGRDKQTRAEVPASEVVKEPVSDVIEMEKGGREV